jgi:Zn-dependent protease
MTPTQQGSIRLFRLWGIEVHLHFSWFLVAFYSISTRIHKYESPVWGALEYLALFVIVLMHEFGHVLACRQVGGRADQIVLWPLGGVAYVAPPSRPGATLWSIAAGPLVNVALLPVFFGLSYVDYLAQWREHYPDLHNFIRTVGIINLSLLCFNLLPVYPLDGGQILRALLWYPLGKARSLMAATVVGFVGGAALVGLALWNQSIWIGVMSLFLLSYCWRSFQQARALLRIEKLPRRPEFACPDCRSSPPIGNFWRCKQCSQGFDTFATGAVCPHCGVAPEVTTCPDCGEARPLRSWDKSIRDA